MGTPKEPSQTALVKMNNRRRVLEQFRWAETLPIAQVAETTDLSKTTIQKIAEYLLKRGFLLPAGKGESTGEGGKKPQLFAFNRRFGYVFSAQIYDSSLLAVITDMSAGVLAEENIPFPQDSGIGDVVRTIGASYRRLVAEAGIDATLLLAAAIGSHGITDYREGVVVTSPHFSSWGSNIPLRKLLRREMRFDKPIHTDNWMRYQAYAEMLRGQGFGRGSFIIVDGFKGGLASGMIRDGQIVRGERHLAGEIGHMVVDPDGPRCACGGRGCLEAVASLEAVEALARKAKKANSASAVFARGRAPDSATVFAAAETGDRLAREIVGKIARYFAAAFANVCITFDPQRIILQGDFAACGQWFLQTVRREMRAISLPRIPDGVELLYSRLGHDRGVVGGALYAIDDHFKDSSIFS